MNPWRGRLVWLAVGLAIAGAVYWFTGGGDRHSLLRAIKRGDVSYSASAGGAESAGGVDGTADIDLTVTRGGGNGALDFVLPAGFVIHAGDAQRLMTAVPVAVHIPQGQAQFHQRVETYCLEPFRPPPSAGSSVSLDGGDPGQSPDDAAAAKLTGCLKDEGEHGERQLGVWLVAQGYLEKPYQDVQATLLAKVRQETADELNAKVSGQMADELRRAIPGASEAQVQRQIDRFAPEKIAARIDAQAKELTDQLLGGFVASKARLQACGYDPAKLSFFQTAPAV